MAAKEIKFLQNFILSVVQTTVDADGNLVVQDSMVHVYYGEIYPLDTYTVSGNIMSLTFADNSIIKGVAPSVEAGFGIIRDTTIPPPQQNSPATSSGSGGCGCGK